MVNNGKPIIVDVSTLTSKTSTPKPKRKIPNFSLTNNIIISQKNTNFDSLNLEFDSLNETDSDSRENSVNFSDLEIYPNKSDNQNNFTILNIILGLKQIKS